MASAQASAPAAKPSFAKIAAAGLKPSSSQQTHNNTSGPLPRRSVTSAPRDATITTPSDGLNPPNHAAHAKKLVQSAMKPGKELDARNSSGLQVRVQNADDTPPDLDGARAASGLLAPVVSDDTNTQLSSSSGSAKPASLDGKSVASGTTFALDEKESLRPDDSASVNAVEDDESFPAVPMLPGASHGAEYGMRAFRDQLREISDMDPARHGVQPQPYGQPSHTRKGVLYVPPPGPGADIVTHPIETANINGGSTGYPPDPKLLEALDSPRDRLMVMKLQTDIIDFIGDPKEVALTLPQCNAYHRMLAHKAADYYMLDHVVDDSASGVRLFKTALTCLRPPLIDTTTPSTAASTPPPNAPQMKILRRGMDTAPAIVNGSNVASKSGSDDGDDDDKKSKAPLTREEREARYETVRLRIMGPAKTSGSPDATKPQDSSRSSSAAGKKSKKKHRSDSEDGFEARSAYSAYYPNGVPANTASFGASHGDSSHYAPLSRDSSQGAYQSYAAQSHSSMQWPEQGYANVPQSPYDLAQDFQRAMSFQQMAVPSASAMQPGYSYQQPYYGAQQPWPQQGYPTTTPQPTQPNNNAYAAYQTQGMSPYAPEPQPLQPYQFGQLPSQTFPGRPANRLEHPLPGSYKGKHFNPQSQTFVPTQPSSSSFQSYPPQGSANTGSGSASPYAVSSPLHSPHGQGSAYGSPRHAHAVPIPSHAQQAQPMLHPLPQPVFPRQASPSLPLPPKPRALPPPPQSSPQQHAPPTAQQTHSSLAKWGTPASLPAKPPPPAQPFDGAKFSQLQRQASYTTAAAARVPSFGSMPPMAGVGGGLQRQ
ncbi:hypothetical protein LTR53_002469 [Teratosphaeriaceae sp. CCFEE 6253]|nr:hypothetical protein LTR53_002469 [Teratosphaeriaceae sp. CCFEE 6253]